MTDFPKAEGVPVRCERCNAPLALLVTLFGPELVRAHDKIHADEDRTEAALNLLTLAEQVRDGAPPVVLGPAIDAFKLAFKLTMLN